MTLYFKTLTDDFKINSNYLEKYIILSNFVT